jgi:hypothetical protein
MCGDEPILEVVHFLYIAEQEMSNLWTFFTFIVAAYWMGIESGRPEQHEITRYLNTIGMSAGTIYLPALILLSTW